MKHLQIPCFLLSTVFHAVLILLLVAGSGFVTRKSGVEPTVVINFIPDRLIAAPLVGGGNPNAPASSQQSSPPRQAQSQQRTSESPAPKPPPPQAGKQPRQEPPELKQPSPPTDLASRPEPVKTSPRKIEVNKVPVVRKTQAESAGRSAAIRAAEEAARAREAERLAQQRRAMISSVANKLEGSLAERSVIPEAPGQGEETFGPGGGGPTYAGYDLYVVSLYQRAFHPPTEITDESATARVRITIARDGTVIESKIISPSGLPALDRAVQTALDRVNTIGRPLPEEIKGDRHTIIIRFNLKTKKLFG